MYSSIACRDNLGLWRSARPQPRRSGMRSFLSRESTRSIPLVPALGLALCALGLMLLPPAAAASSLLPPGSELTPVQEAAPFGTVLAISGGTAAATRLVCA